jgi:hypothetical protein
MTTTESQRQVEEVCTAVGELFDAGDKNRAVRLVGEVVSALVNENRQLGVKLREALRKAYGRSSEKVDPNQLRLLLDDMHEEQKAELDEARKSDEPAVEDMPPPRRRRPKKERPVRVNEFETLWLRV